MVFSRLTTRLIAITLALLAAGSVLLFLDRLQSERAAGRARQYLVLSTATRVAAAGAARPLEARDQDSLQRLARELAGGEVVSVRFVDKDGQVLAAIVAGEVKLLRRAPVLDGAGNELGTVEVGLADRETGAALTSLQSYAWRVLAIFGVISLLLALTVRWMVGRPLQELTAQAEALGRGDLNLPIGVASGTELGDLADRLDVMRRNLKTSQKTLVATNSKLNDALTSLDVALDEAHAASRAKTNFLATMSHEIRTPMNGVLGMAQVLRGMDLTHKQRAVTDTICHSAEALLSIINDILDFSKIEEGKLVMEAITLDLRQLCEELVDLLSVQAQEKSIDLLLRYPADVPRHLIGDGVRLRQIITNLVGNGIKFTAEGHVLINVVCEREVVDDRAMMLIEVIDTGIGIPADKLDGIFERFTQADSSTTRTHGGTGLGLAISQRLVEMMGGEMGVDSEYGRGSTFWFRVTLPVDAAAEERVPLDAPPSVAGLRALVIDDHDLNRQLLLEQLVELGMEADGAASGQEGLHTLQLTSSDSVRTYDVVLVEAKMAEMQGGEVLGLLAEDRRFERLIRILITSPGARDAAAGSPIDKVLVKPVRHEQLHRVIASAERHRTGVYERPPTLASGAKRKRLAPPDEGAPLAGRVLLVEDNLVNQKVALALLTKMGLSVEVAANGQEGVERQMEGGYDLILMDCQMPVMDGFEATKEIRHWEHLELGRPTPIIAMTANAMEGDRERCLQAGMDDYIAKPVRKETLRSVIGRWLADVAPDAETIPAEAQPDLDLSPPSSDDLPALGADVTQVDWDLDETGSLPSLED